MPQLKLHHSTIADVYQEPDGHKTVLINCQEEDFFDMLDNVNPKNIIKYLDMRGISHREPMQVNLFTTDKKYLQKKNGRKIVRILRDIENNQTNTQNKE